MVNIKFKLNEFKKYKKLKITAKKVLHLLINCGIIYKYIADVIPRKANNFKKIKIFLKKC